MKLGNNIHIYVAGPYSAGNSAHNIREAVLAADTLLGLGYVPFVPHLHHFWDLIAPGEYEQWMALDLAWLEQCNALLRLPGDSPGADREVEHARSLGMDVFNGIPALHLFYAAALAARHD